jgi:hypothetical protein
MLCTATYLPSHHPRQHLVCHWRSQSAKGRKHTHLLWNVFICKMNLSFIKRAPYSYFLRSLSSTFVVNENCFSEKWPLKRHRFRRNGERMSLQVVRCELLGTSSGLCVVSRTAGRYPVWARSSRSLALEAISCKIYRHRRNIHNAGRELELVAWTKTNLSRD